MADHFLSKIRVTSEDFVTAGDVPALERHAELKALLTERAGPKVAALFAEPLISRGNDTAPPTVAWYSENIGEPRPLDRLSPIERDRAETYLAEHLRPLRALAADPATADLALAALSVYGRDDVVLVGDRPVIVNWGLLPDGGGANAVSRPAHFAATLGRYVALTPAQDAATGPVPASAMASAAVTPAALASAVAEPPGAEPRVPRAITPLAWVPLLVLLLLAGAALAWLLMPGTRLFHTAATPPVVTDAAALRAARALNDSLRERRAALQAAVQGAVCRPDGVLVLPDGRTPEGLTPPAVGVKPERKAGAAPDALLPNSPARVLLPDKTGEASLLALIEARTVLVLASPGDSRVTTGSGFLIGPGLVVTNQHVIAPSQVENGQILVTGGALSGPQTATVLKTHGPLLDTGGDFALLQIEDTGAAAFSVHLPSGSLKLHNVVAAGFPGDVLETDISYAALKSGDLSAVPGLTVTDGIINTEQQIGPDTHVLMHSAALSSGNSGGPLVDMCGRLVGVNSFVRQGRLQNRGFALTTGDLMAFLTGTAAAPQIDSQPCSPVVMRAQATADPDATPAGTPGKAGAK
ncbi:trypsin-like peptidase domain-containing protein [Sedimentitalea sp. HM32M-2]|uniref:trypsin-like peptidase domain-containing protein n=1 Tax=Sedimentitalea sp. HM32M-2 TaxID=3351566 RepID=UPI0036401B96